MSAAQGFAQHELGQILFLLSEFRQEALTFLYEAGVDHMEGVTGLDSGSSFGHALTLYPVAGLPWLSLHTSVDVSLNERHARFWWDVSVHLVSDGEQAIFSRLRTESPHYAEPGPHTVQDIHPYAALPSGSAGVSRVETVCREVLTHMTTALSAHSPRALYDTYKLRFSGPQTEAPATSKETHHA